MNLTDEGMNEIEKVADRKKNVVLLFQIQILRELRELKELLNKKQNASYSGDDRTDGSH